MPDVFYHPAKGLCLELRPPLTTTNQDTWKPAFRSLWRESCWHCLTDLVSADEPPRAEYKVTCPWCRPDPLPSTLPPGAHLTLTPFSFVFPGPCGRAVHTLAADACPSCRRVLWAPLLIVILYWTAQDLMNLSAAEDQS